jgi:hypothetical protein
MSEKIDIFVACCCALAPPRLGGAWAFYRPGPRPGEKTETKTEIPWQWPFAMAIATSGRMAPRPGEKTETVICGRSPLHPPKKEPALRLLF